MKPSDVIYWNKFSNCCEYYNQGDMRHAKYVDVYGREYVTEHLVEHLLMDRKLQFDGSVHIKQLSNNIFYMMLLSQHCSMEQYVPLKLTVKLKKQKANELIVEVLECIDTADELCLGNIRIIRGITSLNNKKCKGASVIETDIQGIKRFSSALGDKALGALAMGLATHILVMLDGKWESIGKAWTEIKDGPKHIITTLQKDLMTTKLENEKIKYSAKQTEKELTDKISKLEQQLRLAQAKNALLEDTRTKKTAPPPSVKYTARESESNYVEKLKSQVSPANLCFVGGNKNWKSGVSVFFPGAILIEQNNFNEKTLGDISVFIIQTKFISHSCTRKILNYAKTKDCKIIYTSKINLNKMAEDVLLQIANCP